MKKLAALLVLVAIAATLSAGVAAEDDQIRIEPKDGGWEVEELIRTVSEYTDQNIQYDAQDPGIRGRKLNWAGTLTLPRSKVLRWFRSALYQQRLVMIPIGPREGRLWSLMELNSVPVTTHPEYVPAGELAEWADADGVYITTTLTLEHLTDTARARNALSQMSSRPVGIINDVPSAHALVISDFAPVVCAMARQLAALDVPEKPAPAPARAPAPPVDQERRRLEQCLVGARTDVAAQYFLNEIRAVDARTK